MLNRGNEACAVIKKHIDNGDIIRIISHNDSDGISAAGVIATGIKEEGGQFHATIIPRLKSDVIKEVQRENYNLFVFSDMGSAFIDEINHFNKDVVIADHHQPSDAQSNDNIIHVNPHLFGIDGSKHLSGSGSSYLAIRNLNRQHLAILALVGAIGDMQYNNGFTGVNKLILEDAISSGHLEVFESLKIASKDQESLFKSIAYTLNPPLKGLTGSFEESTGFLEKIGVSYGIKFSDLEGEEQDALKDALININPEIFGEVFYVAKEEAALRNLEDFSSILDACGKNKKYGLALSIALGERGQALDSGVKQLNTYRNQLIKGFDWIRREGAIENEYIQSVYSEDKHLKLIIGTIAGVGLSIGLFNPEKPVIGISRFQKDLKISARTTRKMVNKGVNLSKAMNDASLNFGGQGGGHDIAAGAMIPYEAKDNFLNIVNDIIESQLNNS
ncbi:MAG: DHH family phosphoesterase [Methanobrevibacter sp.]|nr:DHH family phosphoesterase [Candidatus Methanoflexus mossambicus]